MPEDTAPRIALVHALDESVAPTRAAFRQIWPDARTYDLLDSSLSSDLAAKGTLDQSIVDRFVALGRYVWQAGEGWDPLRGILFTCSAFGPAIDVVKAEFSIPVLRPNEAAFRDALNAGSRIGLLVSFLPSLKSLQTELESEASKLGKSIQVVGIVAEGALEALRANDPDRHDQFVAEAAARLKDIDVLVLGQFSLARAADRARAAVSCPVITTPEAAIRALRRLVVS